MPRVTGWRPCRWLGVAVTAAASAWAAEVRALRAAGGWRLEARARRSKAVRWRLSAARRASWVRALCASGPRECASAPLVACDRGRSRTFRTAWVLPERKAERDGEHCRADDQSHAQLIDVGEER